MGVTCTTGHGLGYSEGRQEQLITDLLRCNIPAERLRRQVLRDAWAGIRQIRLEDPTWTSGTIHMDLFLRAPPPAYTQQEQSPPPNRDTVSPPAEGAQASTESVIGPDLPRQRPHTLSDASTLPRDPSPLSTTTSPPSSPSLLVQEEQEEDGQQDDSSQPTEGGRGENED